MRILIEIRGGTLDRVTVEQEVGPVEILLRDHDEKGEEEIVPFPHEKLSPDAFTAEVVRALGIDVEDERS